MWNGGKPYHITTMELRGGLRNYNGTHEHTNIYRDYNHNGGEVIFFYKKDSHYNFFEVMRRGIKQP